jgi:DNA-binding transcriptional MerR regulator
MDQSYSIGRLADEFAVTPRTIRFYEDKELLHPARNGLARVFSRGDRARLKLILRGRRLGFSLAEIKEMLDLYNFGDGQVEQLRVTLQKGRERIATLEQQRDEIESVLSELREGCRHVSGLLAGKGIAADDL